MIHERQDTHFKGMGKGRIQSPKRQDIHFKVMDERQDTHFKVIDERQDNTSFARRKASAPCGCGPFREAAPCRPAGRRFFKPSGQSAEGRTFTSK